MAGFVRYVTQTDHTWPTLLHLYIHIYVYILYTIPYILYERKKSVEQNEMIVNEEDDL